MGVPATAIYPGSFDPITNGHLNLLDRSLELFDTMIIAVAHNVRKPGLFTAEERVALIEEALKKHPERKRIEVDSFSGLLVDYASERQARTVIRGLRAISDFEFEFQMVHMNRRLNPKLETVFMMTGEDHFYVSSQLVREVARFDGKLDGIVPPHVAERLKEKYAE